MVNAQQYLDTNYPEEIRSQITELDLSNKGLEGWLNFPGFTSAHLVNLSFNKIIGLGWSGGNSLEVLDASNNNLGPSIGASSGTLKFINFSNNFYRSIRLNMPTLTHLDFRNNSLVELKLENTTDLQALDVSNNWNLVKDNLALPNHFNPVSFNCKNTSLGKINFLNSSVFDCQTGKFIDNSFPLSPFSPQPGSDDGLSNSDKIALGTGVGLGVPGLFLTAFGAWVGYKQLKIAWKEHKENKERKRSIQVETEPNELGEGTSRTAETVNNQVEQQQFQTQIQQPPK